MGAFLIKMKKYLLLLIVLFSSALVFSLDADYFKKILIYPGQKMLKEFIRDKAPNDIFYKNLRLMGIEL